MIRYQGNGFRYMSKPTFRSVRGMSETCQEQTLRDFYQNYPHGPLAYFLRLCLVKTGQFACSKLEDSHLPKILCIFPDTNSEEHDHANFIFTHYLVGLKPGHRC